MLHTRIIGTGAYAPTTVVTNADLEKRVATSDAWIFERTGIRERRRAADDEVTSDMAVHAARRALELAGLAPGALELIIVGTVTPDMPMPACAAIVQHKLQARSAFAFDVSAACAGSLYALSIADQFIRTGKVKNALVIGVELLSRIIDWEDRATCVLFGDAAGAMVLGPADGNSGVLSTHLYTDGSMAPVLCIPGGGSQLPLSPEVLALKKHKVQMNGREVFRFAVRALADACEVALAENRVRPEEVTHLIAHQANIRIVEAMTVRLGLPLEKCWINIDKFGNTSSASLPMTLDEANRAGRLQKGDLILMAAIGAGMSWGSAMVRW